MKPNYYFFKLIGAFCFVFCASIFFSTVVNTEYFISGFSQMSGDTNLKYFIYALFMIFLLFGSLLGLKLFFTKKAKYMKDWRKDTRDTIYTKEKEIEYLKSLLEKYNE